MDKRKKVFISLLLVLVGLLLFSSGSALAGGNSGQGKTPLEKARQVLEEKLADLPGFAGIAHSEEAGQIIVFLENEQAKRKVPGRFEGFPVRTEITGRFQALPTQVAEPIAPSQANTVSAERLGVVRPLIGGISLSAYIEGQGWAGTLGMVTYDNRILSNAHVIAMDIANNFLPAGTPVIQPGSYDGGTSGNQVGTLEQYIPIKFRGRAPNYADAAIATLDVKGSSGWQFGEAGDYHISGTTTVAAGETVRKSGRTTGVTTNEVYVTNASVWVDYGPGKRAYFVDQIAVFQPFIDSGDSGSLVDKGGSFVGLAFAASPSYAIVCKASFIIDGLGISVAPPPALQSIAVTPETASIAVGSPQQFTATGTYCDGGTADLTTKVVWTSDNTTVATIDASGLATGVAAGEATITATLDLLTDSAILTVTEAPAAPTVTVSITMSTSSRTAGPNTFVWAIATVSVGVEGATVEGHWEGAATGSVSGTTNANGNVSLQSNSVKNPPSGTTFTFVVDRVTKGDVIHELTGELSDSITI